MDNRVINGFRVRCAVVADGEGRFQVEVWTRKVGTNAPEKSWPLMGGQAFATREEAEQLCSQTFDEISGVRANGEPEYGRAPAAAQAELVITA